MCRGLTDLLSPSRVQRSRLLKKASSKGRDTRGIVRFLRMRPPDREFDSLQLFKRAHAHRCIVLVVLHIKLTKEGRSLKQRKI
jgi:hypothetical protein